MRASTVPDRLVDADVDAAQIGETSDGGAEGAVPFFLLGLVVRGHVQVEASYGERSRTVAGGELGERVGGLEGECVGGVDDVTHFVVHLSTGAEEMDGERGGLHFQRYYSHWKRWMTAAFTTKVQPGFPGCLNGA